MSLGFEKKNLEIITFGPAAHLSESNKTVSYCFERGRKKGENTGRKKPHKLKA